MKVRLVTRAQKNWFRIVKHPILETKVSIRAGDYIHTMYDNIQDRISALTLDFILWLPKYLKVRKGN